MTVVFHDDPAEFRRLAGPFYAADPVRHTVPLALLAGLGGSGGSGGSGGERGGRALCTVWDAGALVGAAIRAPSRPLQLDGVPPRYVAELVSRWCAADPALTGVVGPRPVAEAFAAGWTRVRGVTGRTVAEQWLYRLGELVAPAGVPGRARPAGRGDLERLVAFGVAFLREVRTSLTEDAVRADLAAWFDLGYGFLFWEVDGEPVSMAIARAPVCAASRISVVYTPPPARGHGYAAAVTAAAARWAAGAGATEVVLHADQDNPTSNGVYRRLGFAVVTDSVELAFAAAA